MLLIVPPIINVSVSPIWRLIFQIYSQSVQFGCFCLTVVILQKEISVREVFVMVGFIVKPTISTFEHLFVSILHFVPDLFFLPIFACLFDELDELIRFFLNPRFAQASRVSIMLVWLPRSQYYFLPWEIFVLECQAMQIVIPLQELFFRSCFHVLPNFVFAPILARVSD